MIRLHREGDAAGARRLHDELRPGYELLKLQTNPIPIKAALNLAGHDLGGFRLPMVDATEQELDAVRGCLERGGVLSTTSA
jgi:4-hydroxy-tetrahydrodipicolinate synthase